MRSFHNTIQLMVVILICLCYSVQTISRNRAWYNNYTLFETDFHTSYGSAKVSNSYGGSLLDSAEHTKDSKRKQLLLDSSIRVLTHSLEIYPENSQSILLYGNAIYAKRNDPQEAIAIYRKSLDYRPDGFFDADYNIGVLYYNQSQFDSAEKYLQIAHTIQPSHVETNRIYSLVLAKNGKTNEALTVAGNNPTNYSDLALAAKESNRPEEALDMADKALASNPNDPTANYVKGICIARYQNRIADGIPYLEKAVSIDKSHSIWLEDLAVAYGMTGRIRETIPLLEEVIRLNPNSFQPYQNLSTTYAKLGDIKKANYYMQLANQKK